MNDLWWLCKGERALPPDKSLQRKLEDSHAPLNADARPN